MKFIWENLKKFEKVYKNRILASFVSRSLNTRNLNGAKLEIEKRKKRKTKRTKPRSDFHNRENNKRDQTLETYYFFEGKKY